MAISILFTKQFERDGSQMKRNGCWSTTQGRTALDLRGMYDYVILELSPRVDRSRSVISNSLHLLRQLENSSCSSLTFSVLLELLSKSNLGHCHLQNRSCKKSHRLKNIMLLTSSWSCMVYHSVLCAQRFHGEHHGDIQETAFQAMAWMNGELWTRGQSSWYSN